MIMFEMVVSSHDGYVVAHVHCCSSLSHLCWVGIGGVRLARSTIVATWKRDSIFDGVYRERG